MPLKIGAFFSELTLTVMKQVTHTGVLPAILIHLSYNSEANLLQGDITKTLITGFREWWSSYG